MTTLGALLVSFEGNTAKLESAMTKAEMMLDRFGKRAEMVSKLAKGALYGIAAGFTFDAIEQKISGAIGTMAGLQQAAEKTGATIEGLSALKGVAKLSDTGFESVTAGLIKLDKSMSESMTGVGNASRAFQFLGISATDASGNLKKPDAVMLEVAQRMGDFQDGAGKTALALSLFGKAGADLLPMLNDLADVQQLHGKVTAEQAAQADYFDKSIKRVQAATKGWEIAVAGGILPVLNSFTTALTQAIAGTGGLRAEAQKLARDGTLADWAMKVTYGMTYVMDAFEGVWRVVHLVWKAIAASAADVVSFVDAFSGLGLTYKSGGMDAVKKQIETGFSEIKQHGIDFDNDMQSILGDALFGQNIRDEMEKNLAAMKAIGTTPDKRDKANYSMHDDAADAAAKKSPYGEFVNELDRMQTKLEQNEYAMLKLKAAQLAFKEGISATTALMKIDELQQVESTKAVGDFAARLQEERRVYTEQTGLIGKTAQETEVLTAALKRRHDMEALILQRQREGKPLTDQAIEDLRRKTTAETEAMEKEIRKRQEIERSWSNGVTQAINAYVDSAGNAAKQASMLFTNSFKSMEDALVNFVKTGKLDFKSLADSIITDLIRIQVQNSIMKPIAAAIQSSGLGSWVGSLFGFGGQQNAVGPATGSVVANTPDVYSIPVLPSFDVGTDYVPRDMIAQIHEGERITPKAFNPTIGNGASGVRVEIVNQGTPQRVVSAEPRFDADGMVLRVLINDLGTNGPGAQALANVFGLRRVAA